MFTKRKAPINFTADLRYKRIQKYFNFDDVSRCSRDFGGIVSKIPQAIFTPPTVKILQEFLKIANDYHIKFTCRGRGHSTYGQSQVQEGVIIDLQNMETLLEFDSSDGSSISIPASKTWFDVIKYSLEHKKKTVPITVDYLHLTVAGTMSAAGIGGTSSHQGGCVDHVSQVDVVTPDGNYYQCSKTKNRQVFDAVLGGGIGQFGIIINVKVPLINAKKHVNVHLISYDNATQFLKEQQVLFNTKVFDHLQGFVRKKDGARNGAWEYVIEAASYYDDREDPRVAEVLTRLSSTQRTIQIMPYWDFINRVSNFIKLLEDNGKLNVSHPWYTILVPEHAVESHLKEVLDTSHLTGTEPIIIYPMNSVHFQQPLFMKPRGIFFLLGALFNTSLDATNEFAYQERLLRNKELYLKAKKRGACRYPIDAISFTPEDWLHHYGEQWETMCFLKEKYDPHHLLSGVNMFGSNLKVESRIVAKL